MTKKLYLLIQWFFYKADFIKNQQKRRLTNTIYRTIYKIYIQTTTNFNIQTLYIIKNYYEVWTIKSEHCTSSYKANEGSSSTYTRQLSMMNAGDKFIVSFVKYSIEEKKIC